MLGTPFPQESTYYHHQKYIIQPSVYSTWQQMQEFLLSARRVSSMEK